MTLYNVLGGLKGGIGGILAWYCIYVVRSDAVLGVMNAVIGTASVPGMLLAPLLAKKIGKRSSLIWFNLLRCGVCGANARHNEKPIFVSCMPLSFNGGDRRRRRYGVRNDCGCI